MLSINNNSFAYEPFDCTEQKNSVSEFLSLLKDPKVQTFLKTFIDTAIATSELKILKRLAACEALLGLDDYELNETAAPSLMQRLESIEEKVNSTGFKPPVEPDIRPTTKTEIRAASLVDHLKETGKDHLTSPEIFSFLKCKLPDNCKINENIQNIRKVKQDVLNKAAAMYPNVFLSKKSTGHREVRLVLAS